MTFSQAVRVIRKRLKETTIEFGARLGVDNSVISRWEREKFQPPSPAPLLRLYRLAKEPDEIATLQELLGGPPPARLEITAADRGAQPPEDKNFQWHERLETALEYADKESVKILKNMLVYCSDQAPKKTRAEGRKPA